MTADESVDEASDQSEVFGVHQVGHGELDVLTLVHEGFDDISDVDLLELLTNASLHLHGSEVAFQFVLLLTPGFLELFEIQLE